jgi:isoleucyl-tRNA synthetase
MGVRGDWGNRYLTLDPAYEAAQLLVFGEIARQGMIYRGFRPVYWSVDSGTALADAEIEYCEIVSPGITVRFPWDDDRAILGEGIAEDDRVSVLIWTTTPWTLPGNLAICLHPLEHYALVFADGEYVLVGEGRVEALREELPYATFEIVTTFRGEELEGLKTRHPFLDRSSPIILGTHVTMADGTGCVHTAPGHGEEDFLIGQEYGLPIISPMGDDGCLTDEAGPFVGLFWREADERIPEWLAENGFLVKAEPVRHMYPHCWRGKDPVLFRCTEQWFIDMEKLREPALSAIGRIEWVPREAVQRITGMMETRPDWCISRQRSWGVPLPIFYCTACGQAIHTPESIGSVAEHVRQGGTDVWWTLSPGELLPSGFGCPECGAGAGTLRKETDTMDVWFDSGTSWAGVLEPNDDLGFPCDLYLEGSDQHRGWFQSSLLCAMATRGVPPYRECVTHGFVVDENGRKMSKSLGNVVDPLEVANTLGADIIRLWVATVDFKRDLHCSNELFEQVAKSYRTIRNTCRFMVGNLGDFEPARDAVACSEMRVLDRWILARLAALIDSVTARFDEWDFHLAAQELLGFCTNELSALYLDMVKDRLYASAPDWAERRSAQTAIYHVLRSLVLMLAPVLTFTTEELWGCAFRTEAEPTVQVADWPTVPAEWRDDEVLANFEILLQLRREAYRAIEAARDGGVFKRPLEGSVTVHAGPYVGYAVDYLERGGSSLPELLIVGAAEVRQDPPSRAATLHSEDLGGVDFVVAAAQGAKCPRCWQIVTPVGGDGEHASLCERCATAVGEIAG